MWSGSWTYSWVDSVIIEMREGKKEGGPADIDSRGETDVKEVGMLTEIIFIKNHDSFDSAFVMPFKGILL